MDKIKKAEKIIIESCEGARQATPFFKSLSDEAYIAYQTGMTKVLNPSISLSTQETFDMIKKLLKEGKI